MNLAAFLHNQKEYKDSILPLPLAPLYVLPHQKWYFSSTTLTPLRKRRENTSFFKYLQEVDNLPERQEQNHWFSSYSNFRQFLCVYEKNSYFDNKIKHIFEAIYSSFSLASNHKQKIKCDCCNQIDEESSKNFIINRQTLSKCLEDSKKNPKIEVLTQQQDKINWYELAKRLIFTALNIQTHSIPEESLLLYKLPSCSNGRTLIFPVLWSNNYLVFNNGNKLDINQNMKSKAVELCQQICKKLQDFIWSKAQCFISKVAEEVPDHQRFIEQLKIRMKVSTFRVWFYKKEVNNQIYVLNLSHITLKGVECIIYNHFNIKQQILNDQITIQQPLDNNQNLKDITQLNKSLQNKQKTFSASKLSHKVLPNLIKPSETERMKNMLDFKGFQPLVDKQPLQIQQAQQLTEIQCSCCKDLLIASEIAHEITASHIQEIQYLRQIKIGKKEHPFYDFVKVCTLCYNAYLKHKKNQSIEKKIQKVTLQRDRSGKNSQSFPEKGSYLDLKPKESSFRMHKNNSKRLLLGKMVKERAKSELNNSKDQVQLIQDKIGSKDRSISLCPHLNHPPRHHRQKLQTTKTTNTDNTINHKEELMDLNNSKFVIGRSQTQEEQPILSNPTSIKFKPQLPSKTHNLINRIISHSFEGIRITQAETQHRKVQWQRQEEQEIKNINTKIIMNAIDQYQKIERVSFKKIVTKNHRMYMLRDASRQGLDGGGWKKPIRSYFNN